MTLFRKSLLLTASVVSLLTLSARPADAATITTYFLTSDHCTGGGGCGGEGHLFGTIKLEDIAADQVKMTVTLNDAGSGFINTGFDGTIGFNLIGDPTISILAGSANQAGWNLVSPNKGTLDNFDGFKTFEYALQCRDGVGTEACGSGASSPAPSPFIVTLTGTGLDVTDFAELSTGNGGVAAYFVVDIYSGITGNTGLIDASNPGAVPDGGATLALLGSALLGLGVVRRRFGRN